MPCNAAAAELEQDRDVQVQLKCGCLKLLPQGVVESLARELGSPTGKWPGPRRVLRPGRSSGSHDAGIVTRPA